MRNVVNEHGVRAVYRGVEAGIAGQLIGGVVSYKVEKYLNEHYPNLGGAVDKVLTEKSEDALGDYESFQVHLRAAIRKTVVHTISLTVSRPFLGLF